MKTAPFHTGELRAQHLAGQVALGHAIREAMPDQHRMFFEALPFVLFASTDAAGAPKAEVLHGAPGFIRSPDAQTLELACVTDVQAGAKFGLLGIDFATRRRNRANGVVISNVRGVLVLELNESFGNCPKYITQRIVGVAPRVAQAPLAFVGVADAAREMVAAADTFFVATSGGEHGLDISHRGGARGFARIEGDTLVIPDLSGNRYFNTLGNLLLDARATLLFIGFTSGDVLTLHGEVTIDWPLREWRFHCHGGTLVRAAVPLRWDAN
jgi:hypothetical protein